MQRRLHIIRLILFFGTFVLLLPQHAFSEENAPAKQSKAPRKATLNFEDELVEGGTQKPELFYLLQGRNYNFRRMIKLRENFLPEMRKNSEDIQRLRGAN